MQSELSPVQIRPATKADFDCIVRVLDRWWGGPSPDRAHPMFFHEFGEHALIAELPEAERSAGEPIVGFLLGFHVAKSAGDMGYIYLVGIHPNQRRRGVGKALYQEFSARCREKGIAQIKAIAAVGHEGPVSFHTALGFRPREEPDYAGIGRPRIVFIKDL